MAEILDHRLASACRRLAGNSASVLAQIIHGQAGAICLLAKALVRDGWESYDSVHDAIIGELWLAFSELEFDPDLGLEDSEDQKYPLDFLAVLVAARTLGYRFRYGQFVQCEAVQIDFVGDDAVALYSSATHADTPLDILVGYEAISNLDDLTVGRAFAAASVESISCRDIANAGGITDRAARKRKAKALQALAGGQGDLFGWV